MFMPFMMPQQQQGGNSMSLKDMKKIYKAFIQAQREMDVNKPADKKKDDIKPPEGKSISKGEVLAYMWVLSPVIGLMTCNMYLYCFTQMKHTLQAFGAQ